MSEFALPCIVCNKQLENVDNIAENQPHKGTAFITHGHYGSTIFDPMDGSYLELNVCDDCLKARHKHVLLGRDSRAVMKGGVVIGRQKVTRDQVSWVPGADDKGDFNVDVLHLTDYDDVDDLDNVTFFDR